MHDSEVVATIVAGNPDGLAEAYDRYASALYVYCRSMLREPADAADAVQDTFVIAASRLAGLRDQSRLRSWLYAVARNECRRRFRARGSEITSAVDQLPDLTDDAADITGGAERAELRTLLRSAVRGLNDSDQDLIELQLRQGLDVADIANMLGVSRNHAHALLSRARNQLEISLGALLVARSGRQDCPALDMLLQDWDGQLTILTRKRINRHIERCPVCAERKRRELAPALLLGLGPLAALTPALIEHAMPPGLREHVMRLASSNTPEAVTHRASLLQQTAPFARHGFPRPLDPPRPRGWRARQTQAAAGAAAVAAVAVVTALAVSGGVAAHHGPPAAGGQGSAGAPGPSGSPGSSVPSAGSGAGPHRGGARGGGAGQLPQPVVSANGVVHMSPGPVPIGSPTPTTGGGGGSPGGGPSPSATAPSAGPSTSPGSPAPSTSTPAPTPASTTPPPPPRPGTLSVTPKTILLSPVLGGSLTLTASGGPVTWSIAESSSLLGRVTVSPSSGTLASGQSVTVSLRVSGLVSVASQLIVNPGGITVSVVVGVG